jgi:putative transcriptional regulator
MKYSIATKRNDRGWSQQDLANSLSMSRQRISDFERGKLCPREPELVALASALRCQLEELETVPRRPSGGRRVESKELLAMYRTPPAYLPEPRFNGWFRLSAARRSYPQLLARLEPKLRSQPTWQKFMARAPSDSGLETSLHLLELEAGAQTGWMSVAETGYVRLPVVDFDTREITARILRPVLVTRDWILFPQVTIATPVTYTVDALLVVHSPRRVYLDLEVDGKGHDSTWDATRELALGLVKLRLSEAEVLAQIPLLERLRALGYCRKRGS